MAHRKLFMKVWLSRFCLLHCTASHSANSLVEMCFVSKISPETFDAGNEKLSSTLQNDDFSILFSTTVYHPNYSLKIEFK